jgi:hypothetical protein
MGNGRDPRTGQVDAREKSDQDAQGAIFSRGAAPQVSPFFVVRVLNIVDQND